MPHPTTAVELARFLDALLVRADASAREIEQLCAEAQARGLFGVCVNGSRVELARHRLEDTDVKVTGVVGFPLGAMDRDTKRFETEAAVDCGAHEIAVVLNVGRLKDGEDQSVLRELRDVVEAADERPVKVLLETSLLNREETARAGRLVVASGADFVVASTGWGSTGATIADVKLLREVVGPDLGVGAYGITDTATALALIEAGATRIGASKAAPLLDGFTSTDGANPPRDKS